MNRELHSLLSELDNTDFESEDYFKWGELQKKRLTSDIVRFFVPHIMNGRKENILFGIMMCIKEAENKEEYEQADILNRCFKSIEKMR